MSLASTLKQRALDIGFDLAGIAPVGVWRDLEFARRWVQQGRGGEMGYLANPQRDDPRLILPSVQSVICVGLVYNAPLPYSTETKSVRSPRLHEPSGGKESEGGGEEYGENQEKGFAGSTPSGIAGSSAVPCNGQRTTNNGRAGDAPRAWISRYAWGQDYHDVMRAKLEALRAAVEELAPGADTRVYVDTGPIVERAFARLSGIGWTGKNTCLINEWKGSWIFLGVMLTSLQLEPDLPAPDRCGSCTRCLEACPTGALVEPYVMDASRCIAYFNIELKGSIPETFRPAIGMNVFGCDICQDVCPWNSKERRQEPEVRSQNENRPSSVVSAQLPQTSNQQSATSSQQERKPATTTLREFQPLTINAIPGCHAGVRELAPAVEGGTSLPPNNAEPKRPAPSSGPTTDNGARTTDSRDLTPETRHLTPAFSLFNPRLEDLTSLTEEDFRRSFARSPIKRVKYRGWLRNLCVAMGNSSDRRFVPWLERATEHPDPVVREHAAWALAQLGKP